MQASGSTACMGAQFARSPHYSNPFLFSRPAGPPRRSHVLSASGMAWKEGRLDFTGAQMVATLKLIAAAMCYQARPPDLPFWVVAGQCR